MSVAELAARAGVKHQAVRRAIAHGDLVASKIYSRVRIAPVDFDAWVEGHRIAPPTQTVNEFADEWWRLHAVPNLTPRTRAGYATLYDRHILPRIGGVPLRDVTPGVVAKLRAYLEGAGVGAATRSRRSPGLRRIASWRRAGAQVGQREDADAAGRCRAG
jgi:hypothetical protein